MPYEVLFNVDPFFPQKSLRYFFNQSISQSLNAGVKFLPSVSSLFQVL